ncbi:MAG: response regulator transcription factor [Candidatus Levybacteria bacterium]|nr:response regulator transcription factor [Candidatus Levybacteria bacterium]
MSDKKRKNVLIAEDDPAICDVVTVILQEEGYACAVIDTFDSFISEVASKRPDLILLDIWLSGEDGSSLAKKLKTDNKTKSIPIVMMSANNETEKIANESGADGFLLKPFDIDDLISTVRRFI